MRHESTKHLFDIRQASMRITEFTAGKSLDGYLNDALLRSAVERQFEIVGEALAQLDKRDPSVSARISEFRRIIAFRNILIHGYADVDDRLVWDMVQTKLPVLHREVSVLLDEA